MANTKPLPGGANIIHAPLLDKATGNMSRIWQQWWSVAIPRIEEAINKFEKFEGIIGLDATVQGRAGTVADALTHVDPVGVVLSPGLVPATDVAAGAVQLPTGAISNTLGSASLEDASAFDAAGSATAAAAAALASAETFATSGDVTTLASAKTYTDGKFPGVAAHTITLLKLTGGGTDGSITWNADGVITGFVDPT
jgi:hypothetical protein